MRQLNKLPLLVVIFFFLNCLSCTKEAKEIQIAELSPQGEKRLNIPDSITQSNAQSYYYTSDFLWYYLIQKEEVIQLITCDVENQTFSKRIFNRSGPNGVRSNGPFLVGEDGTFTIYLPASDKIIQLDERNTMIGAFSFPPKKFGYRIMIKNMPLQLLRDKFYFLNQEFTTSIEPTVKLIGAIDKDFTEAGSIISYPEEFQGHVWSNNDLEFAATFLEERIVISFYKSDYLYSYDYNGNLLERKIANWPTVDDAQPIDDKPNDPSRNLMHQMVNGFYQNLIYDKYRKRFYRLVLKSQADVGKGNLTMNQAPEIFAALRYGMIILDEQLNIIERYELEDVNLAPYLVTKEGVYFPAKNRKDDNQYVFLKMLD